MSTDPSAATPARSRGPCHGRTRLPSRRRRSDPPEATGEYVRDRPAHEKGPGQTPGASGKGNYTHSPTQVQNFSPDRRSYASM